jgi:hypothetical protein
MYNRQKAAGVDAIIMDDVAKLTKVALSVHRLHFRSDARRSIDGLWFSGATSK